MMLGRDLPLTPQQEVHCFEVSTPQKVHAGRGEDSLQVTLMFAASLRGMSTRVRSLPGRRASPAEPQSLADGHGAGRPVTDRVTSVGLCWDSCARSFVLIALPPSAIRA